MAIIPENRTIRRVIDGARAMYRAIVVQRNTETGSSGRLAFLQAKGRGDPDDAADQDLVQETDLDHAQHYGFHSYPPADTELLIGEFDGGEAAIAERAEVPSDVPTLASADSGLWCLAGHYIQLDNDGNLIVEPASGKFILLGDGATEFLARADLVLAELQQIKTDFDNHTHAAGGLLDSTANPCSGATAAPSGMTAPSSVACSKAKGE